METTNKKTIAEMLFDAVEKVTNNQVVTKQVSISGNVYKGLNNSILSLEQEEKKISI